MIQLFSITGVYFPSTRITRIHLSVPYNKEQKTTKISLCFSYNINLLQASAKSLSSYCFILLEIFLISYLMEFREQILLHGSIRSCGRKAEQYHPYSQCADG